MYFSAQLWHSSGPSIHSGGFISRQRLHHEYDASLFARARTIARATRAGLAVVAKRATSVWSCVGSCPTHLIPKRRTRIPSGRISTTTSPGSPPTSRSSSAMRSGFGSMLSINSRHSARSRTLSPSGLIHRSYARGLTAANDRARKSERSSMRAPVRLASSPPPALRPTASCSRFSRRSDRRREVDSQAHFERRPQESDDCVINASRTALPASTRSMMRRSSRSSIPSYSL